MASPPRQPNHAGEGNGDWTFVGKGPSAEEREPQIMDNYIPSSQTGEYTADNELSAITSMVGNEENFPQGVHRRPGEVNGIHAAPFNVDSSGVGESTATGSTSSNPQDDGAHTIPLIPTFPPEPIHLTPTSLDAYSMPGFTYDIQAWVNGDPSCWQPAATDDHVRVLPVERAPTRHSSTGSLGFIFVPAQPCSVGRDIQGAGTVFDGAITYSDQLEIE